MKRVVVVLVGLLAALAPVLGAATPGGAASAAHSPSFVGVYAVHGMASGGGNLHGTLTVNADGTATAAGTAKPAHWSSSGTTFTMTYKTSAHGMKLVEVFVGTLSKTGIGTKKSPGTFTFNGDPGGTWWAVRTS